MRAGTWGLHIPANQKEEDADNPSRFNLAFWKNSSVYRSRAYLPYSLSPTLDAFIVPLLPPSSTDQHRLHPE